MNAPRAHNRNARRWLLLAAGAVAVAILVATVDPRAVAGQIAQARRPPLLAASALLVAGLAAYAGRWRSLLGPKAPWWPTFHAANLGHAVNLLVPLRAGEPARVVRLAGNTGLPAAQVAASVVVERLIEQLMRLVALGGAVALGIGLPLNGVTALGGGAALAAALAIVWLLARRPALAEQLAGRWLGWLPGGGAARVRANLRHVAAGLAAAARPGRLALTLAWSVAAGSLFWAFYAAVATALPAGLAEHEVWVLSLAAMAIAPPSAPAAPGIYHASLTVPLLALGFAAPHVAAYAVLAHALLMGWMLGLAAWGLARGRSAAPAGAADTAVPPA